MVTKISSRLLGRGRLASHLIRVVAVLSLLGLGLPISEATHLVAAPLPLVSAADVNVIEGNTASRIVTVQVVLSLAETRPSTAVRTVDYRVLAGSTTPVADFYIVPDGTLTFRGTSMVRFVRIRVRGDIALEPDETIRVVLSNPINMRVDSNSNGSVTVRDDDRPPRGGVQTISVSSTAVAEGDRESRAVQLPVNMLVVLSTPAPLSGITVRLRTDDARPGILTGGGDGDPFPIAAPNPDFPLAMPNQDYLPYNADLHFGPGQLQRSFTVNVLADRLYEFTEVVPLLLTGAPGGWLVEDGWIEIRNDDSSRMISGNVSGAFTSAKHVAAGAEFMASIRMDGTLWTRGANDYGQLGIGASDDFEHFGWGQVGASADWTNVATGGGHSLAIRDGRLFAWGRNEFGQLGLGTNVDASVPMQATAYTDWIAVAAGEDHSLAIRRNGTLWTWGRNTHGQLGLGTRIMATTPTRVLPTVVVVEPPVPLSAKATGISTPVRWIAVAGGFDHSLALKSDGSLWAFGLNSMGQLGTGTVTTLRPERVGMGNSWASIAAGHEHSFAINNSGHLYAFGSNENGQLGTGDRISRGTPTRIYGAGRDYIAAFWLSASAGAYHSVAIDSEGHLFTWGWNMDGQLLVADTADNNLPTLVDAGHFVAVAAGDTATIAIRD